MPEVFPAALLLPADAFDTSSHQVMGRRVAGRHFAQAMAAHLHAGEQLLAITLQASEATALQQLVQPHLTAGASLRCVQGLSPQLIASAGSLHLPDPGLAHWVQVRPLDQPAAFSLTGVIHTLCSERVLRSLQDLLLAPLRSWDALVCTSVAGRRVVEQALEARLEQIRLRFQQPALRLPPGPQLPVIPLAIDAHQPCAPGQSRAERRQWARQQLGLPPDAFVVAFVGRLSFHSKAHPLVLYRALARLAESPSAPPVVLLECGHVFNEAILEAYVQLQADFPQLRCVRVGGLQPASEEQKWQVLAAADVFTSPGDNLQETFGLSLLEAMAAELPLVVSDWNGYRDLVRHGDTGFLVPTTDVLPVLPQPDATELYYRLGLLNYDSMVGLRALGVVVDEQALHAAFRTLLEHPDRRAAMAARALQHLQQHFSWEAVAPQYRQLWAELAALRAAALEPPALAPLEAPYGRLFSGYATAAFQRDTLDWAVDGTPIPWLCHSMQADFLRQLLAGSSLSLEALAEHLSQRQASRQPVSRPWLISLGLGSSQALAVMAALLKLGVAE